MALRILTDSVKNCYAALGVIHNRWRPIPGRIKDFIAIPRPNLYQSLHTSVVGPQGQTFEVQIRTEEMHRIAEEGIAAHWKYKEGRKGPAADDQRIAWLRHLVEWQRDMQDPGEFMSTLKVDLYPEEAYTFTPQGQGDRAAPRSHADRFRLRHPLRRGQYLRRRQGQRPHRSAALAIAQRRHRRDHDPARPPAEQGLAGLRHAPRARATRSSTSSTPASASRPSRSARSTWKRKPAAWACNWPRGARPSWRRWPPVTATARRRTCTPRWDTASSRRARCSASWRRNRQGRAGRRRPAAPDAGFDLAGRRARPGPAARRRRRHQGPRRGRPAGVPRQVLQPHPRRGHRGLRDARQGRGRALPHVPQRAEPDVRRGAQDRSGMGARGRGRLPGAHRGAHRRPPGHAEPAHRRALRREYQYPQPGGQGRNRTRTAAWSR